MIGIIGAMTIEIEGLVQLLENAKCETFSHLKFFSGKLNNKDCVIALCGPGKVNAAICSQILISKYRPAAVISTGVAGALEKNIKIGDIVLADFVVQHDMDTSALGDARGFISGIKLVKIPCSNFLNRKIISVSTELNEKIHRGIIATGDQFISNKEKLLDIKSTFNAIACEMEAGSIGQVCFVNRVNFAAFRIISDDINDENPSDYEKFKIIASKKIANLIAKVFINF